MPGYHNPLQRKDRTYAVEGVITYISHRYYYDYTDDLEVSSIETLWIEMESAYIENKEIILMCDFNIDLLRDDEVPIIWKYFNDGFSLTHVIEEPTRVTP